MTTHDETIIGELRTTRRGIGQRLSMMVTLEEVDALLRAVDERDELRRQTIADWEPDGLATEPPSGVSAGPATTAPPEGCPRRGTSHDCPLGGCADDLPREVRIPDLPATENPARRNNHEFDRLDAYPATEGERLKCFVCGEPIEVVPDAGQGTWPLRHVRKRYEGRDHVAVRAPREVRIPHAEPTCGLVREVGMRAGWKCAKPSDHEKNGDPWHRTIDGFVWAIDPDGPTA